MAQVPVRNWKNQQVRTVEIDDAVLAYPLKRHLIYEAVCAYRAGGRAGTHKTKNRVEVSGGGRKPWKQKGTGRARSGSNTSPLWVGGGRAHGPEPHAPRIELPKKQRRQALASALSLKARESRVAVLDDLAMAAPRTKDVAAVLKKMGLDGAKALLVTGGYDENVWKSCRNMARLAATPAHQVHTYALLDCETVVFTKSGLERLTEVFAR